MEYKNVILEKKEHIATVTLGGPEALKAEGDRPVLLELQNVWEELDVDDETRVVILTGAGRAFWAGADVGRGSRSAPGVVGLDKEKQEARRMEMFWSRFRAVPSSNRLTGYLYNDMEMLTKPIIASINGDVAGGGVALALRCDIRIASEEATFSPGATYTKIGLSPLRLAYYLPRAVGMGAACYLLFTGKTIDAKEALRIGLVDQVVPHSELAKATYEMASCIAELPPLTIRIIKRNLYMLRDTTFDIARYIGDLTFPITMQTEDFAEGVTALREGRKPVFKGR